METITELSKEQLKELGFIISSNLNKERIKEKKAFKQNAFHNTKMLLTNYHKLKTHSAIVDEQLEEDKDTFWNHEWLSLNMLMQNKARTVKLMKHVDNALIAYKAICRESSASDESRRYEILRMKYLDNVKKSDQLIADRYDVDRTTIVRNVKDAIDDISIILFGIDMIDEL